MSILSKILGSRTRAYKYYSVATFYDDYRGGFAVDGPTYAVFERWNDAMLRGDESLLVYDDEIAEIIKVRDSRSEAYRRLSDAAQLNNDAAALERAGDIDSAVSKYEQNILPGTYFTLYPYRRLCIIYHRRKDYGNEIRVLENCLSRPEWHTKQYAKSSERAKFEDRLAKAKQAQTIQTK